MTAHFTSKAKAFFRRQNKKNLFVYISILVLFWQLSFINSKFEIPKERSVHLACGIACGYNDIYAKASVFLYHKGLFPVFPMGKMEDFSKEGVEAILEKSPSTLVNDEIFTIRSGELGKVWLFYPSIFFSQDKNPPSIVPTIIFLYFLASIVWLVGFYYIRESVFGVVTLVLLTSSELVRFEVFSNVNVFSLAISAFLFAGGVFALLSSPKLSVYRKAFLVFVFAIGLGFLREIRTEPFIAGFAFIVGLLFLNEKLLKKALFVGLFFLTLAGTQGVLHSFWNAKMEEAIHFVKEKGGHPFPPAAMRQSHHELWHPLWCGLGDFDRKYGFKWDDKAAYESIIPVMKNKYNMSIDWRGEYMLNEYWDEQKIYQKRIGEYPVYHEIAKEQVVDAIKKDPFWYGEILLKRIGAIFSDISPVSLSVAKASMGISVNGLLILIIALVVIFKRFKGENGPNSLFWIALILMAAALCLPSLLVTSALGATYISIYHYVALGVIFSKIFKRSCSPAA